MFTLAASCWLAAGPGGLTVREVLACRHDAMHHMAGGHAPAPSNGPCFCDQMGGAPELVVETALPALPIAVPASASPLRVVTPVRLFPLPPSPLFGPTPPPPIGLV